MLTSNGNSRTQLMYLYIFMKYLVPIEFDLIICSDMYEPRVHFLTTKEHVNRILCSLIV